MLWGHYHFKRQQYMTKRQRDTILSLFPIRNWFFNKVACRAQLYQKKKKPNQKILLSNNVKWAQNILTVNMKSVSSSTLSVKLPFTSPEVHVTWRFFSSAICIRNDKLSCWEDKFYLPERQTPGSEGLKHNLPTASIKDTSVAKNLRSSVYKHIPVQEADPHFAQLLSTGTAFVMFQQDSLQSKCWKWDKGNF